VPASLVLFDAPFQECKIAGLCCLRHRATPEGERSVIAKWITVSAMLLYRVGQNRIYSPYITVYLVISLPKTLYIHRIYLCMYGFGQPYEWISLNLACVTFNESFEGRTFIRRKRPCCPRHHTTLRHSHKFIHTRHDVRRWQELCHLTHFKGHKETNRQEGSQDKRSIIVRGL
jgi:hypothetical protein